LNEKYIAVMVTYEGKVSYPIELFYSTTFPTLFFVDSEDESFFREPIYYVNYRALKISSNKFLKLCY